MIFNIRRSKFQEPTEDKTPQFVENNPQIENLLHRTAIGAWQ